MSKQNKQKNKMWNTGVTGLITPSRLLLLREKIEAVYIDEFKNLILSAFKQPKLDFRTSLAYRRFQLFNGVVGVDKSADVVTALTGSGIDIYGYPKRGTFLTANGKSWTRDLSYEPKDGGAFAVYAFPNFNSFTPLIYQTADILTQLTLGIRQNAIACQTPSFITVDDPNELYSLKVALDDIVNGAPAIIAKKNIATRFESIKSETPFIADKLKQLAREFENDFLARVGILSANSSKRERVQTEEITASVGEVVDRIYIVIDNNNKQCDAYGLDDYKYELNGSIETLYANEMETTDKPENGTENDEKEVTNND